MKYEIVFSAVDFAVRAHRGQFRKGTIIPYVVHPIAVGRCLMEQGAPEALVLAGFLHDTLEDTGVSGESLRESFGDRVVDLVLAVTERDKSLPWERRKKETLARLRHASEEVLLLSLADKLDNIQSIHRALLWQGESTWSRFNRPRSQQAWYYGRLAELFGRRIGEGVGTTLVEAFNSTVLQVFQLNSFEDIPSLA